MNDIGGKQVSVTFNELTILHSDGDGDVHVGIDATLKICGSSASLRKLNLQSKIVAGEGFRVETHIGRHS